MKKYVQILSSCVAAAALLAVPATQVNAKVLGPDATTEEKIERLVELNPGTTEEDMRAAAKDYIAENGGSFDDVIDEALEGAEEAEAEVPGEFRDAEKKPGDPKKVQTREAVQAYTKVGVLPRVRIPGDIFFNPANTSIVKHGHVGIYSAHERIVEAPGIHKKSHETSRKNISVFKTSRIMYVKTTESNRRKAGAFAAAKLVDKGYNLAFAMNKSTTGKNMNCSQLVWAAYKAPLRIDLDGNGGPGVYPKDIVNSSKTVTWKKY